MNPFTSHLSHLVLAVIGSTAIAQDSPPLKHSLFSTSTVIKTNTRQGSAVAADGAYFALVESGSVKIYSSGNGDLLHRLNNVGFATAVALSGTRLAVGNPNGFVYVFDLAGATPTRPVVTLIPPGGTIPGQFGAAVGISGTRVVVGAPQGQTTLLDANSGVVRVFDLASLTPTTPVVVLPNPSPADSDLFGAAVAISGSRLIVGAPQDDTTANDSGIAYVYDVAGGTPTTPVLTLDNPSPGASDLFGSAVTIAGTNVIVGAPNDDTDALNSGRAYAYDLLGGTPAIPRAVFINPAPTQDDFFGTSVAAAGQRAVIGAPKDDALALDSGRAYFYDLVSGTPETPVLTLDNQTPDIGDLFGSAVAVSATHVLVGAPNDDDNGNNVGAGHFFDPASGTPTISIGTLKETTPTGLDEFGTAVAADGSLVAIGAPLDNEGAQFAGRVYVFDLAGGTPTDPTVLLNNPSPANSDGDGFGEQVAVSGSLVVVGAARDDTEATASGRAYVFDMSSGTPTVPVRTLNNPLPVSGDFFGNGVGISGNRVVVGAPGDQSGSVHVYDLGGANPTVPVLKLKNPDGSFDRVFGKSIAIAGARLALGSPPLTTSGIKGRVYLHDLARANAATPVRTFNDPTTASTAPFFGTSVALLDPLMEVGSPSQTTDEPGVAHVYDLGGAQPATPIFTLRHPSFAPDATFGASVAFAGTLALAGDPDDDFIAGNKGAAYAFGLTVPGAQVNVATQVTVPDPTVPPGTVFNSFSAPDVAIFGGTLKTTAGQKLDAVFDATGTVLLRSGEMRAVETGGPMAMVMKLMPPTGDAVLATFQRGADVRSDSDQTLFTGLMTNTLLPAARRGQEIPGHPGVKLKSFLTIDGTGDTTFFSATLKGTGVTTSNNVAIFATGPISGIASQPESGAPVSGLRALVRKGDIVFGKKVRTIATLVGQAGTLAEGRWRSGPHTIGVRLTFTDKTQALYLVPADADDPSDWLRLGQTDDFAAPDLPAAKLLSFKLPAYAPEATVFESLLRIGPGGITKKDNSAVFDAAGVATGGPITLRRLAQRAGPVPAPFGGPSPGSGLRALRATLAGLGQASAFIGQATLPGQRAADSIFDARDDGQPRQIARIGEFAPGGGKWGRFTSVAKPDGTGYGALISALLAINKNIGVTAKNRAALFAVDSTGELRRLLRAGDRLESTGPGSPLKPIKSFVALMPAAGSIGAARGYDAAGRITVLVTFTDRTQAVVTIQVP